MLSFVINAKLDHDGHVPAAFAIPHKLAIHDQLHATSPARLNASPLRMRRPVHPAKENRQTRKVCLDVCLVDA